MDTHDSPVPVERIAEGLAAVDGVVGVVLGGSRARGTNDPDSDYDIGVYYSGDGSLDVETLSATARRIDDDRRDGLIAPPGTWGGWVNGGGWLTVNGRPVDILLRDVGRVGQAVADCTAGVVHAHYQTGHPHAYVNTMYAGELAVAKILRDGGGRLAAMRRPLLPYPDRLRRAVFETFGFEAGFSLMLAEKNAEKGDDYYVAAHVVRSISCLNQVLFAVNGEYCINEKRAVAMIDAFPRKPENYGRRTADIVAGTGRENGGACRELGALVEETRGLMQAFDNAAPSPSGD